MLTSIVDTSVVLMDGQEQHDAEIRLMGLILAQSALVGVAIGVFDAGVWLINETAWLNGFTYAMAAFFVQGIAYYVFKMFFEQGMQERVRTTNLDRNRQYQYRVMQENFDKRRADMELRMREAQLEQELRWMEQNPGQIPPSWGVQGGPPSLVSQYYNEPPPNLPSHTAMIRQPLSLGVEMEDEKVRLKKDGTIDKRYNRKNSSSDKTGE